MWYSGHMTFTKMVRNLKKNKNGPLKSFYDGNSQYWYWTSCATQKQFEYKQEQKRLNAINKLLSGEFRRPGEL